MLGEELLELGYGVFDLPAVFVIDYDRQGELAEVLALHAEGSQGAPKLGDRGLFRVIDQVVLITGVLPVLEVRDEARFRIMMMASAAGDLFPCLCVFDWIPLGDDMKVGWNIEQAIEDQWPCFTR